METLNTLLSIDLNYIVIGLIVLFYTLEQVVASRPNDPKRPRHFFHNALFYVTFFVANLFFATVIVSGIEWLNKQQVGLFYLAEAPVWLKLAAGVAFFDLVTYWFHRMAHRVPLLWRFHRVHHSDTAMDSSTYLRSHPLELIFWFGLSNVLAAGIFGLDVLSLGFYFLVGTPFFIMEHTSLTVPKWVDQTFGLIFTTPNMHKVHHEQDQHYTDSNYADIFILWDRIFGTYKYKPAENIKFGLKEFDDEKKQTFWYQFISPFLKIDRTPSDGQETQKQPVVIVKNTSVPLQKEQR